MLVLLTGQWLQNWSSSGIEGLKLVPSRGRKPKVAPTAPPF